jgi:uncharacterized membrane protein YdjX (TVP38/TMEM64 family)
VAGPLDEDGHVAEAAVRTSSRVLVLRLALLGALLTGLLAAVLVTGVPDADDVRADVAALGTPAPAAFVLLYAGLTLLPVPRNVLSAAAGLLFGLGQGVLLALPGALLGAVAGFGLGRLLGREAVERFSGRRVARLDALLAGQGLVAVLVARLVPVLPFTGTNYAAGLTAVRFRDFAVGTAVGIGPGTVAYVALGAYGTSPTSWPFLVAVGALLLLSLGGAWLTARRRRPGPRRSAAGS